MSALSSFNNFQMKVLKDIVRQVSTIFNKFHTKLQSFRYEKLQRWEDALKAYTTKASQASSPHLVLDAISGM